MTRLPTRLWHSSRCSALPFSAASRSLVSLSTSAAALSCSFSVVQVVFAISVEWGGHR